MNKKILAILCLALGIFSGTTAVSAESACVKPPEGMIAWWPGDGNAEDIIGGRNGTLINNVAFAPGMVGEAFSFNRRNYVMVPDSDIWTLGDNQFTIDLWVNFNSISGRDPFIGHDESGGQYNKWIFWYDAGGHRYPRGPALRFHINSPTIPPLDPAAYLWRPTTGRWYHVAVTRSGSAYTLYVDGVPVITEHDYTTIPDPNFPLTIGRSEHYWFAGLIDEVEIFDRALTAEEIAAIYNAGSAGKCQFVAVDIDIKPGSDPNSININNKGVIPVAILTTDDFDAADVNADTVKFGLGDASPVHSGHIEDIDSDGDIDLVLHFNTQDAGIGADDTEATLTGETTDGQQIEGSDSVRPLDKGGKKK